MLDQLLGHPWHICWFPCKYISINPKEVDEREFLFVVQPGIEECYLRRFALWILDGLHANVVGVGLHCRLAMNTSDEGSSMRVVKAYSIAS
jgi:hypothetical protein